MNSHWNLSTIALVLWIALSLLLPAARAVGLFHLSWWICAAPFGILFLLASVVVVFAGVVGRAAFIEAEQQQREQRDVASASRFARDGADGAEAETADLAVAETSTATAPFLISRFLSKK